MTKITLPIICGVILSITTGCANHDMIVFATNTQLGARVGVDARQMPEIEVGYNRQEGALVPLYIAQTEDRVGPRHPTISGILQGASRRISEAKSANEQ